MEGGQRLEGEREDRKGNDRRRREDVGLEPTGNEPSGVSGKERSVRPSWVFPPPPRGSSEGGPTAGEDEARAGEIKHEQTNKARDKQVQEVPQM
ncbi:hypothetical protein AAFF_G00304330 [Aldrovandia affinis]|uniref:Uncharacterized protein n=1 Tax=Aldrovandia affinis TaxID=143900 RepID=A0AAD7SP08_9TELE|nr:hypothetical protein AAFF_G00304330 [Aldrovandia affinis]